MPPQLSPFIIMSGPEGIILKAEKNRVLKFTIHPELMSFHNEEGKLSLEDGAFRLEIEDLRPANKVRI